MNLRIIHTRNIWFALSGALAVVSILAIIIFGLRFGIDFTGGSLLEVTITDSVTAEEVRSTIQEAGYEGASVQTSGERGYIVRTSDLTQAEHQSLINALDLKYADIEELRFDSIGPIIGTELRRTAIFGVVLTLFLIGLYVAWAYRGVSKPVAAWKYGALTILASIFDVLVPVGIFAIFGEILGWEIGATFVAAVLTILGYSINDKVVIFDRTRENLLKGSSMTFEDTVELSVNQTLARSINTGAATLLALLTIFLFGGDSTKPFALTLMIGIIVGTYSSIFLASPALVAWERFGRKGGG
jgi:preprotein translocase subunit SecF